MTSSHNHLVTVIMPVRNSAQYVGDALRSIQDQDYQNIEILVVDNASTDESTNIVKAADDKRVRVYRNDRDMGIAYSLNFALERASGKYIARMDADDISYKWRISAQVDFMEASPEIGICGSCVDTFGAKAELLRAPEKHAQIKCKLFFSNAMYHPSVMIRAEAFRAHNLRYSMYANGCEDYQLWVDASKYLQLANIQKPLLRYRLHEQQTTNAGSINKVIRMRLCEDLIGRPLTGLERECHEWLIFNKYILASATPDDLALWRSYLIEKNKRNNVYDNEYFVERLGICYREAMNKYREATCGRLRFITRGVVRYIKPWLLFAK